MVKLGFHVSIAGSLELAISRAQNLECDTIQIFTRSPRIWAAKPIAPTVANAFKKAIEAGRQAYLSGLGRVIENGASASSPLTGFLES